MLSFILSIIASIPPFLVLTIFLGVSIKDMLKDGKIEWFELAFSGVMLLSVLCASTCNTLGSVRQLCDPISIGWIKI